MKILPIKILLLVVFPSLLFAQGIETSPYSIFGLGDEKYAGPAESVSMGGLNSIFWDNIHVNPNNPATYSFLSLTNYSFGAQGKVTKVETDNITEEHQQLGVSHLIMGIPMGKWGLAFGFMPTSSTGYDITGSVTKQDDGLIINNPSGDIVYDGSYNELYSYNGFGGMNRFFIGTSYSPFKGFSVGVNAHYEFGNLSRTVVMVTPPVYASIEEENGVPKDEVLVYEGNQYQSKEEAAIRIRSWDFQLGLMYTGDFSEKLQYTLGATYGLGNKTGIDYSRYLYTFKYNSSGAEIPVDTLSVSSGDYIFNNINLPSYGSFGLSIGKYSKWMLGVNYEFEDPVNLSFGNEGFDVVYKRKQKYSVGGYYTPKYNSLMSYAARVTYRAGFKYEDLGLQINGIDIVDYSINFGFGLPMSNGASNVNIGGAFGVRGTTEQSLIKESYFSFVVSFSLNDKWFKKVKYN